MSPCFPQKKKVLADLQRGLYGADERTRTFTPEHKNLNLACLPVPPRPPNNKKRNRSDSLSNGDPTGTRTRVTAVKGRCLNRLTMGPKEKAATS